MLTSFVQQAGFEPPAITVAVKKGRPLNDLLESSGVFHRGTALATTRDLVGHQLSKFSTEARMKRSVC